MTKKEPQWDQNVGLVETRDAPLAILALDPAKSTGWCLLTVEQEPLIYSGQCDMQELNEWLKPLTDNYTCLVAVERGYISTQSLQVDVKRRVVSERNTILLMERIGYTIGWVCSNVALAAPIWRPTPNQWRSAFPGWLQSVRGREQHKQKSLAMAAKITGRPLERRPCDVQRGRRHKGGKPYDDEADAICIAYAAQRLYREGKWKDAF